MKKVVLVETKTLEAVKEFAAGLKSAEDMVDMVLEAARLERTPRQPMSLDKLQSIMAYAVGGLGLILGAAVLITLIICLNI